jgi:hypothetical protein
MTKTQWKPKAELEYSLKDARRVSILSCNGCARKCATGGNAGIDFLTNLLGEMGKEILLGETVSVCCDENSMRQVLETNASAISRSDTLVIASCAPGVKAAYLCASGTSVVGVLDTIAGCRVTTQKDNMVVNSICYGCGRCVISHTGGICPLSECPKKMKYGPCGKAPKNGAGCTVNPTRDCIWITIAQKTDVATLKDLRRIHKAERL